MVPPRLPLGGVKREAQTTRSTVRAGLLRGGWRARRPGPLQTATPPFRGTGPLEGVGPRLGICPQKMLVPGTFLCSLGMPRKTGQTWQGGGRPAHMALLQG